MSNTLRRYTSFEGLGLTEATATVASIVTAMGNNSMFAAACATDGKTAGWLPESYGFLRIHKVNIYYAMAEYQVVWPNAELWRGYYNAGDDGLKWSGWQPIATATPPQEFDLPLAEGYTQNNGCKYSKDQFNVVRVTFNLSKSAGTIAGGEVVATLPAGFRPKRYWACVAIGNNIPSDAATRHPVVVQVATNGEISASMMVETDQAELRAIVCAMEFLAAD